MVFITAGMGGGTGTGAAPVVARIARQLGRAHGRGRDQAVRVRGPAARPPGATTGLNELRAEVDTLIVIPNQRLLHVVGKDTPLTDAFAVADEVLLKATKGISDLVTVPGLVNLDFADVKSIMADRRATRSWAPAARPARTARSRPRTTAVSSPLLEDVSIAGAQGVLLNITGGRDLTLHEVNEASNVVIEAAGEEANVIFGAVIDPDARRRDRDHGDRDRLRSRRAAASSSSTSARERRRTRRTSARRRSGVATRRRRGRAGARRDPRARIARGADLPAQADGLRGNRRGRRVAGPPG